MTPAYQGHAVIPTTLVPGAPMLGYDARAANGPNIYPLMRSSNDGASWQALPVGPANFVANTNPVETPDGTVYVTFAETTSLQVGIFKLAPGASQWVLVSPLAPGVLSLHTVVLDANGRPITVWGLQETSAYTYIPWTHKP